MSRLFTSEEIQFLRDHAYGRPFNVLTDMLNSTFKTAYIINQVSYACRYRRITNNLRAGFKKGHKLNLGNKYAKGLKPSNYLPIGTETIRKNGVVWVKISDTQIKWQRKHILIWESIHGSLPDGHCIVFADGDKHNFSPENLLLVSDAELMVMNSKGLIYDDSDLTKAGHAVAKVVVKIHEKSRGMKDETNR